VVSEWRAIPRTLLERGAVGGDRFLEPRRAALPVSELQKRAAESANLQQPMSTLGLMANFNMKLEAAL
jgi:hypothetical protein